MSKGIKFPFPGLFKGMALTFKTMVKKAPVTMYPDVKEIPVPRARGVISLDAEACTVCMLCARECPDWCIYIEGHKVEKAPSKPGGRVRTESILDRFDIDYGLCMYCGICVDVCPFDALFWSPEYEYSEMKISNLLHNQERLGEWLETVPEPPALES
ncbi:MAG: 4Fe-4S binding protein [Acidimicrobiia bacterium]